MAVLVVEVVEARAAAEKAQAEAAPVAAAEVLDAGVEAEVGTGPAEEAVEQEMVEEEAELVEEEGAPPMADCDSIGDQVMHAESTAPPHWRMHASDCSAAIRLATSRHAIRPAAAGARPGPCQTHARRSRRRVS